MPSRLLNGAGSPLWTPPNPSGTRTFRFRDMVNRLYGLSLSSYEDLYNWSVDDIARFWSTVWDETGVVGFKGTHVVDDAASPADNPAWFADAELNWAENMLRHRSEGHIALISVSKSATPTSAGTMSMAPTQSNPRPIIRIPLCEKSHTVSSMSSSQTSFPPFFLSRFSPAIASLPIHPTVL